MNYFRTEPVIVIEYANSDSRPLQWKACSTCGGSGHRYYAVSWAVVILVCPVCGGSGGRLER